jgi:hypothetical protein
MLLGWPPMAGVGPRRIHDRHQHHRMGTVSGVSDEEEICENSNDCSDTVGFSLWACYRCNGALFEQRDAPAHRTPFRHERSVESRLGWWRWLSPLTETDGCSLGLPSPRPPTGRVAASGTGLSLMCPVPVIYREVRSFIGYQSNGLSLPQACWFRTVPCQLVKVRN